MTPRCLPDLRDELAEAIYGALSGSFGDFGGNHSRRAANAILPIIERETTRARAEGIADPPAVSTKAIRAWMDRAADYPTSTGQVEWVANRDELIAVLPDLMARAWDEGREALLKACALLYGLQPHEAEFLTHKTPNPYLTENDRPENPYRTERAHR